MVGSLNKLPVAASGMLFFGDPATFASVSAILLGFVAGLVYGAAKTAQSAAQKKRPSTLPLSGSDWLTCREMQLSRDSLARTTRRCGVTDE